MPFSFLRVEREDILKEIQNLDIKKTAQESDMPSLNIKENSDIFLSSSFNDAIKNSHGNVTLVLKKGERYSKNNYGTVGIVSNVSKVF